MTARPLLPQIVRELIFLADRNPDTPAERTLSRGLTIRVTRLQAHKHYILELRRIRVYPSEDEARTVVGFWPYVPPADVIFQHSRTEEDPQNRSIFAAIGFRPTEQTAPTDSIIQ